MDFTSALPESDAYTLNIDQWPSFTGHKPLSDAGGEIRLLHISHPEIGETLSCKLLQQRLDVNPRYVALSYYSGAPGYLETLLVDGIEVQIRQSLHCFLMNLTSHFSPITVWLDAICIDQNNSFERNCQVAMMGQIFKSAEKVYAWLGHGDPDCDHAMAYTRCDTPASFGKAAY